MWWPRSSVLSGGYTRLAFPSRLMRDGLSALDALDLNLSQGNLLLLTPAIFPPSLPIGGVAAIAAWWGNWHIVSGLGIVFWWRREEAEPVPVAA